MLLLLCMLSALLFLKDELLTRFNLLEISPLSNALTRLWFQTSLTKHQELLDKSLIPDHSTQNCQIDLFAGLFDCQMQVQAPLRIIFERYDLEPQTAIEKITNDSQSSKQSWQGSPP